jgi:hypothetical protein
MYNLKVIPLKNGETSLFRHVNPPSLYKCANKSSGQYFEIQGKSGFKKRIPLGFCNRSEYFANAKPKEKFYFPLMNDDLIRSFSDYFCHGFAEVSNDDVELFTSYGTYFKLIGFVSINWIHRFINKSKS